MGKKRLKERGYGKVTSSRTRRKTSLTSLKRKEEEQEEESLFGSEENVENNQCSANRKGNGDGSPSSVRITSKRLGLDESAASSWLCESDSETEATGLHVERDGRGDRLDMIHGYHIVSLPHVLRQHEAIVKHSTVCTGGRMLLEKPVSKGLFTVLHFRCITCRATATIETNPRGPLINQALAWGTLSVGMGHAQSEELLSVLNVAAPSEGYFRKCERIIGQAWKNIFDFFRRANVAEEIELAKQEGRVDPEDNMPFTSCKTDGGWCARTYGHGFDAKSGVAVSISQRTGKIMTLGTENKFCKECSDAARKGVDPDPDHTCNATYKGPSTGMESAIIVKGLQNLYKEGLWVQTIIGDGDSSVFNKVRQFVPKGRKMKKEECANHATRRYTSKLHSIVKKTSVPLRARRIVTKYLRRLTAAARGAIKENGGKSVAQLREDLRNGPLHVLGDHSQCRDSYCKRKEAQEPNMVPEATATGALGLMHGALQAMYAEAHKLTANETTNDCESYMSKVSKFTGGKRVDFSTGPSFGIRCLGAALLYTLGPSWHLTAWQHWQGESLGPVAEVVLRRRHVRNERKRHARDVQRQARLAGEWTGRKRARSGADKHYGLTVEQLLLEKPDVDETVLNERKLAEIEFVQNQVPTEEESRAWEERTRGQSGNPLWREFREKRLQGYLHGRIARLRPTTLRGPVVKLLLYGKDLDHLEHIQLGRTAEDLAKQKYEAKYGVKVVDCGSFVRPDLPHLLASPDGLVGEDGLVEVKNFSTLGDKGILETFKDKASKKKLRGMLTEKVVERRRVQSQLNLSKRKWCDLILHCDADWERFRIHRDEKFFNDEILPKLQNFYNDAFLPELADSRLERGLPPREPAYVLAARMKDNLPVEIEEICDEDIPDDGEGEDED
ncbi:hypothetical protein FOCC_FOCC002280, partial [Frankliniella occidentalis]